MEHYSSFCSFEIATFANVLGHYLRKYVKSIETHALAFLTLIILSIGTVYDTTYGSFLHFKSRINSSFVKFSN